MPPDHAAEVPDHGHADYRFVLANERTYLAYVRTALALLVAGAALVHVDDLLGPATPVVGAAVMLGGAATTVGGFIRWRHNDERIQRNEALAASRTPVMLTALVTLSAVVAVVLVLLG